MHTKTVRPPFCPYEIRDDVLGMWEHSQVQHNSERSPLVETILAFIGGEIASKLFGYFVGALLMTAPLSFIVQKIRGKLRDWKDFAIISACIFLFILVANIYLSPQPKRPNFAGSLYDAHTFPSADNRDTFQAITVNIANQGEIQSAVRNFAAVAEVRNTKVVGEITYLPDTLTLTNSATDGVERLTIHKVDDILTRSISPIEIGAVTVGILYVRFRNLDYASFRSGGSTTVYFEDVFGKTYSAKIETSPKIYKYSRAPGLSTDLVCRP